VSYVYPVVILFNILHYGFGYQQLVFVSGSASVHGVVFIEIKSRLLE